MTKFGIHRETTYTATKRFEMCYAHHLPRHEGKCKNEHGHNVFVDVSFRRTTTGRIQSGPQTGMVVDFGMISNHVKPIIESMDHKNLNNLTHGAPIFNSDFPPTAENICNYIAYRIIETPIGSILKKVRIWESRNNYVELEIGG